MCDLSAQVGSFDKFVILQRLRWFDLSIQRTSSGMAPPQGRCAWKSAVETNSGAFARLGLQPPIAVRPMSKEVELKLELPVASLPGIKKLPMLRAPEERPKRTNEVSVY